MVAVYVPAPWAEPVSSTAIWLLMLAMVPILMLCVQPTERVTLRRVLACAVVVLGLAAALSADVVVMHPCETCKLVEPGSWEDWYCKWILWC